MLFNSVEFMIFLPIVVLLYFILPKKIKNLWLLVASYFFYMCWNAKYALLILSSTIITYISGILMERIKNSELTDTRKITFKKLCVAGSFILNLGILGYFKYFNFFIRIIQSVLARVHVTLNIPQFDILLPVGISFYTFQALSYTMDVYRDDIYAEKNFFRYALFVSFFPQLVAGPIERSKNLLKQLANTYSFTYENFRNGIYIMLWGYFLKLVIADRAAVYVDTVYSDIETYGGCYILLAIFLFAIQIYCDFYGYSLIAKGAAKLLGINLIENFEYPFLRTSIADLWRGWHISLSGWFKDYLYIPLGGSRKGRLRKYINIMIVFLASGLWHGASFNYVIWGGINGLYQVISDICKPIRTKIESALDLDSDTLANNTLRIIGTFILFLISLLFFRASSARTAIDSIHRIFSVYNPWILFDGSIYNCGLDDKNFRLLLVGIALLLFSDICKKRKIVIREIIFKQNAWFRCLFVSLVITFILVFGVWGATYDTASFIYFQF